MFKVSLKGCIHRIFIIEPPECDQLKETDDKNVTAGMLTTTNHFLKTKI